MNPKPVLNRRGSTHAAPEVRQRQILDAAMVCFGQNGYQHTTIDGIAAQAGLSKGTVYRFYTSKEDLLIALVTAWEEHINARFQRSESDSAADRLYQYGKAAMESTSGATQLTGVWLEFLRHQPARDALRDVYGRVRDQLSKVIADGVRNGEFRNVDCDQSASTFIALLEGVAVLDLVGSDSSLLSQYEAVWVTFTAALYAETQQR